MALVELAYAAEAVERGPRARTRAVRALGKTAVEVPDIAGFVVNRLLFPYLFSAVDFMEQTRHGARGDRHVHAARRRPSDGPARAARLRRARRLEGDRRGDRSPAPPAAAELVAAGHLGKKTGQGFLDYERR